MNYSEAFALFERLGLPAPIGNETFILKAAEHIRDLEAIAELRFDTIPKLENGDILVVKSDNFDEQTLQKIRSYLLKHEAFGTEAPRGLIIGLDNDSDLMKLKKPGEGDVLVFRTSTPLSQKDMESVESKLPTVKCVYLDADDDLRSEPAVRRMAAALQIALRALSGTNLSEYDRESTWMVVEEAIRDYTEL